jgi:hypothetical protein
MAVFWRETHSSHWSATVGGVIRMSVSWYLTGEKGFVIRVADKELAYRPQDPKEGRMLAEKRAREIVEKCREELSDG